jgi:hypothetical protein
VGGGRVRKDLQGVALGQCPSDHLLLAMRCRKQEGPRVAGSNGRGGAERDHLTQMSKDNAAG